MFVGSFRQWMNQNILPILDIFFVLLHNINATREISRDENLPKIFEFMVTLVTKNMYIKRVVK